MFASKYDTRLTGAKWRRERHPGGHWGLDRADGQVIYNVWSHLYGHAIGCRLCRLFVSLSAEIASVGWGSVPFG